MLSNSKTTLSVRQKPACPNNYEEEKNMKIKVGIWSRLTVKDKMILLKAATQHSFTKKTA